LEERKNVFHEYLRDEEFDTFNREVAKLKDRVDLEDCNLRNLDLRKADLRQANLKNSYLKLADIRGLDLSKALIEGASIHNAHIGGTLFPIEFDPQEILLSVQFGTRLRLRK
jgi:uncharacterized protein YjbI with pentapeptide repeats